MKNNRFSFLLTIIILLVFQAHLYCNTNEPETNTLPGIYKSEHYLVIIDSSFNYHEFMFINVYGLGTYHITGHLDSINYNSYSINRHECDSFDVMLMCINDLSLSFDSIYFEFIKTPWTIHQINKDVRLLIDKKYYDIQADRGYQYCIPKKDNVFEKMVFDYRKSSVTKMFKVEIVSYNKCYVLIDDNNQYCSEFSKQNTIRTISPLDTKLEIVSDSVIKYIWGDNLIVEDLIKVNPFDFDLNDLCSIHPQLCHLKSIDAYKIYSLIINEFGIIPNAIKLSPSSK